MNQIRTKKHIKNTGTGKLGIESLSSSNSYYLMNEILQVFKYTKTHFLYNHAKHACLSKDLMMKKCGLI